MDDDGVPADWPLPPGQDPQRWLAGEPGPPAGERGLEPGGEPGPPPAGEPGHPAGEPGLEPPLPEEVPWWASDEYLGSMDAEHEAWLASLPAGIRADYLAGPYTGAGEAIAPGFTHRDPGGPAGAGFAAGGALDRLQPGPWLASALVQATGPGERPLTDTEQIGVLCGWQRQVAWAQAGLAAAAIAVARRRDAQAARSGRPALAEHVSDEVAAGLTLTLRSANRLLAVAAGLDRLPAVAAALAAGQIDWARACLIVDQLAVLDDDTARRIAGALLARAGEQTSAQLRAALLGAVLAADPHAAERRKTAARADTRVDVWDEPSGNNALAGRELRTADAIAADAQLTADARWLRANGAPGTLAELRAAAYIARLTGHDLATLLPAAGNPADAAGSTASAAAGSGGTASNSHGDPAAGDGVPARSAAPRPGGTINLTMPLSAYAGLDDAPGEAAGHGPVDAATGRDLAALLAHNPAIRWCITLTGADGRAVAHACARKGPATGSPVIRWAAGLRPRLQFLEAGVCSHPRQSPDYAWPASLRHLIEIRQPTCCAPGCRRPARRCDIDHTIPFEKSGLTCECNGAPLCRRHHRAKQAPRWHLTQHQPGHMTWQTPGDRHYTTVGDPCPV